jgi:hypothetical protein
LTIETANPEQSPSGSRGSKVKDRCMMSRLSGDEFENKIELIDDALLLNCMKVEQQEHSKWIDDRCKGKVRPILNKPFFLRQLYALTGRGALFGMRPDGHGSSG